MQGVAKLLLLVFASHDSTYHGELYNIFFMENPLSIYTIV